MNKSSGIGFLSLLALVFIALKLAGFLDWSWWWVLAPLWMPGALAALFAGGFLCFAVSRSGWGRR